ncbi:MAG TPA: Flp pilus assembly protein CpaB, partial [Armatimonadota bacterium]|nr:Flp pilus assembly protein CpaB [Armatimonadota bacterium]
MGGLATKRNVLVLAALLGVITSILVYRFLENAQAASKNIMVPLVVTTQEILPRTVIDPTMLTLVRIPLSDYPPKAFRDPEDIVGKVALTKMPKNAPIKSDDVADKGVKLGLSYTIPPTMRAVTVAVDPVTAVGGYLKPGDHVDVVATFRIDRQAVAKLVLQDVQLLALGTRVEKDRMSNDGARPALSGGKDTATLLVTPSDAEKLVLAENEGKLRLILRPVGDVARIPSPGVSSLAVVGSGAKVDVQPAEQSAPAPVVRLAQPPPNREM